MGVSQNEGYLFLGVPYNKDYGSLGSMLGSPYLGKLPYCQGEDPPQLRALQQHPLQPSRCAPGGCEALPLSGFRGPVLGEVLLGHSGGHAGIIEGKR